MKETIWVKSNVFDLCNGCPVASDRGRDVLWKVLTPPVNYNPHIPSEAVAEVKCENTIEGDEVQTLVKVKLDGRFTNTTSGPLKCPALKEGL